MASTTVKAKPIKSPKGDKQSKAADKTKGSGGNAVWWTIPQTLAWIVTRDYGVVRGVLRSTTAFNILVYFLQTQSTFKEMPKRMVPALVARDEFYTKCKNGKMPVWAASSPDGPMGIVSAADWQTIDVLAGNNPNFTHHALGGLYEDTPRYFRALILRTDVLTLWPEYALNQTPDFEIERVVDEAIRKKGDRLTTEEIYNLEKEYRRENSTVPQREKFRLAQNAILGEGKRGRKPKI